MSAEYSVEEVRKWIGIAKGHAKLFAGMKGAHEPWTKLADMLRTYAKRIEADDFSSHTHDGKPVACVTNPASQPAQVSALKCTAFLDGLALDASDAETLAYIRARFSVPAKPVECANGCPAQQVCDYCQSRSGKDAEPTAEPVVQGDAWSRRMAELEAGQCISAGAHGISDTAAPPIDLAAVHNVYSSGVKDPKHCPECGTYKVELIQTCHNSNCINYANEITFYKGWI